jgi:signal transduction histidine kinase
MAKYLQAYWAVATLTVLQFVIVGSLTLRYSESIIFFVGMLAFGLVGAVIIAQVPGNRIGWVFAFIGIFAPLGAGFQQIAIELLESGVAIELITIGQIVADTTSSGFFLSLVVLIPLWFPSGTPINRYVGFVVPVAFAAWVMVPLSTLLSPTVSLLLDDSLPAEDAWLEIANPFTFWAIQNEDALAALGYPLIAACGLVALVSMVVRTVKSRGVERLQMKWLLFPEGLLVAFILLSGPIESQLDALAPGWLFDFVLGALVLAVPISVGVAITKYRLYDINVVISKTVTYGALAVFITGVYALVVVGIGSLVGSGDEPNLALSIVAVAIVAVAFEPLRNRLQRWANRIVFGERSTPYEVLSQTTAQLAGTGSPDEALQQVTQLVVDGTGAAEAVLWLKAGGSLRPTAATPEAALTGLTEVPVVDDHMPVVGGDTSTPVRYRGEILGALSITKPPGESVTGVDEKMLHDVASGTGLLLRNIGLNTELVARAEQLRSSRRRLVAAHDAERHRLERDLHDGAQQQVVAIKVKLGIARTLAEREGAPKVESLVSSLAHDTQKAVDAMRAVAHGIYPPLLEAEGLGVALNAARRTSLIPIDLDTNNVGRYERPVEESVYFCILETVARAIDGGATWTRVELTESSDSLHFTVHHDGNIQDLLAVTDRIDAFGGRLVTDVEGTDHVVTGHLPAGDLTPVTV